MEKYTVFVAYSLADKSYTERPSGLPSTHKLFDTPEEAINAIVTDIEKEYNNFFECYFYYKFLKVL